jgi:lysophospholipase L1-like esterase
LEADVGIYNETVVQIAKELGVPVNDLFARVQQIGRDTLLLPDGVHFTPEGYQFLGENVANFITETLRDI